MKTTRVLLVDDNEPIRQFFKNLLADVPNLNVIGECSDGIQVVPFLQKNKVDVIFMDVIMQFMNGYETITKVKESYSNIKIIGFSSFDHVKSISKMKESGADGFISKFDVNRELVISELKKVMN